jgi:cytochrome c553
MTTTAKGITDAEIASAATYFAAQKPKQAIKVVEADTVPKTRPTGWHLAMAPEGGTEPIGERIIEVPENLAYFSSRDGRAKFIAYVPPGSLKKGEELAATGGGRTVSCRVCHGQDLKGLGNIPGIAGRSPSYIIRRAPPSFLRPVARASWTCPRSRRRTCQPRGHVVLSGHGVCLCDRVVADAPPVRLHEDNGALSLDRVVIRDHALELTAAYLVGHLHFGHRILPSFSDRSPPLVGDLHPHNKNLSAARPHRAQFRGREPSNTRSARNLIEKL